MVLQLKARRSVMRSGMHLLSQNLQGKGSSKLSIEGSEISRTKKLKEGQI